MTDGTDKPLEFNVIESVDQLRKYQYHDMVGESSVYMVAANVLQEINELLRVVDILNYALRELQERAKHS